MKAVNIVLVTGGTGDIATAITRQISDKRTHVIALDIVSPEEAEQWKKKLAKQGIKNVSYRRLDVTDFDECKKVIDSIIDDFDHIDALINNAGITKDAVFYKMTKKQWDDVLTVNLDGIFNVTRHVVGYMRDREYGRIVNISSVNAQKGQFSQANYSSSKAGIYGFTKTLAQELMSKNITVNSLSPGYVNTRLMEKIRSDILENIIEQIPARRLAEPEEIAWAVAFLIDEKSRYITGSNLCINGGLYME